MSIFSDMLSGKDPIGFGLLNGSMEVFVAGRTAEKKQAREAAKKAAEIKEANQKTFVDTIKNSQELSSIALTSPYFKNRMTNLAKTNPDLYNAVAIKSLGAREVTPYNEKIITQASGNSTFAANFIASNGDYLKQNPNLARILKTTAASPTLTEGQNRILSSVKTKQDAINLRDSYFPVIKTKESFKGPLSVTIDGGRPVDTKTGEEITGDLTEYRDGNPTKNSLFWVLNARAEQEDEFEGLSDTNINTMKATIEAAEKQTPGSAIIVANNMIKRIDPKDVKSKFFLESFKVAFGKKENSTLTVSQILEQAVTMTSDDIKDDNTRGMFAKEILNTTEIKNLADGDLNAMLNSTNKKEQKNAMNIFALKSLANTVDKVAKGQGKSGITYGNVTLFPAKITEIGKNRTTADAFLSTMNNLNIKYNGKAVDIEGFLNALPAQEKAMLISDITSTMKNHNTLVTEQKVTDNGAKFQERPDDYRLSFPELYKIPEIKAFIHGPRLGQPPEGFSLENNNLAGTQTSDGTDTGNPLPANQFKLKNQDIVTVQPEVIEFANAKGFSKVSDMLKDDGYFEALSGSGGFRANMNGVVEGNNKIFKASNAIIKQVPNIANFVNLRQKDFAAVARTIINQNIDDDADIFQVISTLMGDDFSIQKQAGKLGYSQEQIDTAVQRLSKGQLNAEDLTKQNNNLNDYIGTLNSAINNIGVQGDRNNAAVAVDNFITDIVRSETGLLKATGSYILESFGDSFESGQGSLVMTSMNSAYDTLSKDRRISSANLASNLITIAYQRAKTLDPNGRISDRDFKAALESITSSFFASNQITKALLMGFKNDAEAQLTINENLLEVFTNTSTDNSTALLKKNIRAIRAVPAFKRVRQMISSINNVRQYRDRFADNGNRIPSEYRLTLVPSHDPEALGISDDLQIYEVRRNNNKLDAVAIGLPIYADRMGKMLTSKELAERGFRL